MYSCKNCGILVLKPSIMCPACHIPADPIRSEVVQPDGTTKPGPQIGRNLPSLWDPVSFDELPRSPGTLNTAPKGGKK